MRKFFFIALLATVAVGVNAQDYNSSLGLRLGRPLGLSYKKFVSPSNAFEVIADLDIFQKHTTKISGSGFYLWQWNLADVPKLSWFVGPGASAGVFVTKVNSTTTSDFNVSLDGLIGLEYKIPKAPLALSADFGPRFYFMHDAGFYWGGALTVRYTF
ncbi:MAG: hypothetical protein FWF52_04975 [Candidatus Azobacteroides sp.]|nr:hypothetical protein [Candidatus Azobacteroides sp.]